MKNAPTIAKLETLSCDAGWRGYYFVKLTTSDGVVGWSEYDESFGPPGVSLTINKFAERIIGKSRNQNHSGGSYRQSNRIYR